ncbi:hypothetical protein [Alteribacillus sp. YIM 98480]|uniref:hypothetical protein n=1 Tax=Alteribacillus sp. YIM 98480 TaxID=2606599 RepID=UPI00131D2BD4|nr:hypothetical protein [Alteribacillus sp. YIM 98480]
MKKIFIGVLSLGLVAAGGITAVYAQSSSNDMSVVKAEQMANRNNMHQMMHDEIGPINYGQMKKAMEQVHPEWTKEQVKEMYNSMHGKNSAEPSVNFEEMNEN